MDFAELFAHLPTAYLVMDRDLRIVAANETYLALLGRTREELLGRPVFEAFPPSPDSLDDRGRNPLQLSFERVRDTGGTDRMPLLQYSVRDSRSGEDEQRFWSLIHSAVLGADGRPAWVLQRVEDVTDYAREREHERSRGLRWRRRAEAVQADLYGRAQELQAALQAQETAARRLQGLSQAALRLAAVDTVEELAEQVVSVGLAALGADGGAVGVRDDEQGVLHLTITGSLGAGAQRSYAQLPLHSPLPAAWAARTGETVLLPDRRAGLRWSAEMGPVHDTTGRDAWVALPLQTGQRLIGSLTASWSDPHPLDPDEVGLLEAFAAQCAQALARLQVREAERRASLAARQMSETLQRSMLTEPPAHEQLETVVRYRPASEQVQIGGDWYDAFHDRTGATCLVIGDVTGHDRQAAAAMGQVRNLLRGFAHTLGETPGRVLQAVDLAMRDLQVDALATAVLAVVEQRPGTRRRFLRWSSAGHLPPLLVEPDGVVRLLRSPPDLILGVDPGAARSDHVEPLADGATVVLYTDGLVERRGADMDQGLTWLVEAVRQRSRLSPDELCDALLEAVDDAAEDDVALLVMRVHRS